MAKTTSTTKAKTKTSKKTASAKSAKSSKSVSTKAKKQVKAVKAEKPAIVATESAKVAKTSRSKKRELTPAVLRKWHGISAVVFAALIAATAALMNSVSYTLSWGYVTSNPLASDAGTVFANASASTYDVNLKMVLILVLGVSAVISIARMRWLAAAEEQGLQGRILPWRWFDMAITGMLMVELAALLVGAHDMVTVKFFGALLVASTLFAWIAERENAGADKFVKASYISSLVAGTVVLLGLGLFLLGTAVYGDVRLPWYAYGVSAVAAISLSVGALIQLMAYRRRKALANYLKVERAYLLNNLVTKVAFAAILIAGFRQ